MRAMRADDLDHKELLKELLELDADGRVVMQTTRSRQWRAACTGKRT
jgi:hypothetical protein